MFAGTSGVSARAWFRKPRTTATAIDDAYRQGRLVHLRATPSRRGVAHRAVDGRITVLADLFKASASTCPTMAVKSDGSVWSTDPSSRHIHGYYEGESITARRRAAQRLPVGA